MFNNDRKLNLNLHIFLVILSVLLISANFLLQGKVGFGIADESFLWYGAQRVLLGEVPIQDFVAYDPGRYYWAAGIMKLLGSNGIASLRMAVAVFQALGLYSGLILIAWSVKTKNLNSYIYIIFCAIILLFWMQPRHKLFDVSCSIFLITAIAYLFRKPNYHRFFILGVVVGLVAVFGRNHGVYGVIGSFFAFVYIMYEKKNREFLGKALFNFLGGIFIGYLPILLMLLFIPDYFASFWESIEFLFKIKTTNMTLPIPWPWKIDFSSGSFISLVQRSLFSVVFMLLAISSIVSTIAFLGNRMKASSPVILASLCLVLPYSHYAFSRADVSHLAQGIFPGLIAMLAFFASINGKKQWIAIGVLLVSSTWILYKKFAGVQCSILTKCESVKIANDTLLVNRGMANKISFLKSLDKEFTPNGENFVVTPYWPGAYPILERKSPMWEIYAFFPRSREFSEDEIKRIKASNPKFILVVNSPLDKNESNRFKNFKPYIYNYITSEFKLDASWSSGYIEVYVPK